MNIRIHMRMLHVHLYNTQHLYIVACKYNTQHLYKVLTLFWQKLRMARVKSQVFKSMQGLLSKTRACRQCFRKRAENAKGLKKFFQNGQVITWDHRTKQAARKDPAMCLSQLISNQKALSNKLMIPALLNTILDIAVVSLTV